MLNICYALGAFVLFRRSLHFTCYTSPNHISIIGVLAHPCHFIVTFLRLISSISENSRLYHYFIRLQSWNSIVLLLYPQFSRKILRYKYFYSFILTFSVVKTLISSTTRRYLSAHVVKKITGWMDLKDRSYILLKRPNFVLIFLLFPHTSGKYCYIAIDTIQV